MLNLPRVPPGWDTGPATRHPPSGARGAEHPRTPRTSLMSSVADTIQKQEGAEGFPLSLTHAFVFFRNAGMCISSCDLFYFLRAHCNLLIAAWIVVKHLPMKVRTTDDPRLNAGETLDLSRRSYDQLQELCVSDNGELTPERYL